MSSQKHVVCQYSNTLSTKKNNDETVVDFVVVVVVVGLNEIFQEAENALHGLNGKLALSKHLIVNWARKQTGEVVSSLKYFQY